MTDKIGSILALAIRRQPIDPKIALAKAPPQPSENWERNALATYLWWMVWGLA